MSWEFGSFTKKDDLVYQISISGGIVDYAVRGNIMWILKKDSDDIARIYCTMLQKSGGVYGYKMISENDSPEFHDVPKKYLKVAPVQNNDWRNKVEVYYNEQKKIVDFKKNLKVGQKLDIENFEVPYVMIKQISPKVLGEYNGKEYRILPKHLNI